MESYYFSVEFVTFWSMDVRWFWRNVSTPIILSYFFTGGVKYVKGRLLDKSPDCLVKYLFAYLNDATVLFSIV